jgi:hypothetical protein
MKRTNANRSVYEGGSKTSRHQIHHNSPTGSNDKKRDKKNKKECNTSKASKFDMEFPSAYSYKRY